MDERTAHLLYDLLVGMCESWVGKDETDDRQLHTSAKKLIGPAFAGVFASDMVPKNFRFCITNVDTHDKPGSHWVAIASLGRQKGYLVYDSFGRHTSKLMPHLNLDTWDTDRDKEQLESEDNCGARCIAWLCLVKLLGTDVAQLI